MKTSRQVRSKVAVMVGGHFYYPAARRLVWFDAVLKADVYVGPAHVTDRFDTRLNPVLNAVTASVAGQAKWEQHLAAMGRRSRLLTRLDDLQGAKDENI